MDAQKSGIRGENEMQNLHYSNKKCIFVRKGLCKFKVTKYGTGNVGGGKHDDGKGCKI